MKRLFILLLCLLFATVVSAQSLRFTYSAVVANQVGMLSWAKVSDSATYRLHRMFHDEDSYVCIATVTDTFYLDTLHRTICGDTVNYLLTASSIADTSSPVGLFYQDNVPTSPCSLRLCSVDTALGQIRLSWYPSPDTDVMGYYICMGNPCLYYDTVWGRLNTTYLCSELLNRFNNFEYNFRILAFDSCYQASPLTPYYHNPRLKIHTEPCSRMLQCSWNRYINMPDSVLQYSLYYKLQGDQDWHIHRFGPDGPFAFDTLIPELAISYLRAYLAVTNPDSLCAFSIVQDFYFEYGDTADYLQISHLQYDESQPSVTLTLEVDPQFWGRHCYIYRATDSSDIFEQIAELTRSATQPEQYLTYTDYGINRAKSRYVYRIGTPDICGQWIKYSDTVQLLLPEIKQPDAYIPNAIIYGDPDNGRFCPLFLSPLADGYSLDIYNRLGAHIFHSTSLTDCWDGNDFQGRPLPQGVYVYKARCHHADGSERIYTGTVTLLR